MKMRLRTPPMASTLIERRYRPTVTERLYNTACGRPAQMARLGAAVYHRR
ncbi:MAG: hypothetical protein RLZZ282_469 [Verrucomicrobiota bacterium]